MKTAIIASLLAVLATTTNAYCPNLCSGHGKCGAKDVCECYEHIGTNRGDFYTDMAAASYALNLQNAWTGADCSLRTCPQSYSFSGSVPSGLTNSKVLASGVTTDFNTLTIDSMYTTTDPSTFSTLSTGSKIRIKSGDFNDIYTIQAVSFSGTITTLITFEKFVRDYTTSDTVYYGANVVDTGTAALLNSPLPVEGAHSLLECAGQGLCDRATGTCDCFPGYEGEACTRTTCPNDCSGHGICLSLNRLASDGGKAYSQAWDNSKLFGCKCDVGFRGPDCSLQECPSDFDPLYGCGGGVCNDGGTGCSNNLKSDCVSGAVSGVEQRDCSGRGLCDYETGLCKCFAGFYGQACGQQTILI